MKLKPYLLSFIMAYTIESTEIKQSLMLNYLNIRTALHTLLIGRNYILSVARAKQFIDDHIKNFNKNSSFIFYFFMQVLHYQF